EQFEEALVPSAVCGLVDENPLRGARNTAQFLARASGHKHGQFWFVRYSSYWKHRTKAETGAQAALVRDIFRCAFRPVPVVPGWLTTTSVAVAESISDVRAFHRLPILADALEDAACDNADILNHCRQQGVHVRGCWVVDLVLNKE